MSAELAHGITHGKLMSVYSSSPPQMMLDIVRNELEHRFGRPPGRPYSSFRAAVLLYPDAVLRRHPKGSLYLH
jgi:hypothetical protein